MDALSTQPSPDNKTVKAAKDFESLLLGQILKSVHEENGWLDSDDDEAGSAAISLGEEQLARMMSASGGIGFAKVIEKGLQADTATDSTSATSETPNAS
jgi:Rod binding domain-containing protein